MLPVISKAAAINDNEKVHNKINSFLKITILIGMPSTMGMAIFAEPILKLLFPNASDGTVLLQINSISIIFMMLAQTINSALQALGKSKIPLIAYFLRYIIKDFNKYVFNRK